MAIYWIRLEKVKYACRMPVTDGCIPITNTASLIPLVVDAVAVTECCGCISIMLYVRLLGAAGSDFLILATFYQQKPGTTGSWRSNTLFPIFPESFPNPSHPLARTLHPVSSSFHCCFASNGTGVTRTSKATLEAGWLQVWRQVLHYFSRGG